MSKPIPKQDALANHRRFQVLARSLHACILAPEPGRIFLLRGAPDPIKLLRFLRREANQLSSIEDLQKAGLPMVVDGEISRQTLNAISGALTKWSRGLDQETDRCSNRRNRKRMFFVKAEKSEIELLTARLNASFRFLDDGCASGAPFLMSERENQDFRKVVAKSFRASSVPHHVVLMARFIYWLSSPKSCSRFLQLLARVESIQWHPELIDQLSRFEEMLRTWQTRLSSERLEVIRSEIREQIEQISPQLVGAGMLECGHKATNLETLCQKLIYRCGELRKRENTNVQYLVPAAVASISVCDDSTLRLPKCLVAMLQAAPTIQEVESIHADWMAESKKDGYNRLLRNFDAIQIEGECRELSSIRERLLVGESVPDINWSIEHAVILELTLAVKISSIRKIANIFERYGIPLNRSELISLARRIWNSDEVAAIQHVSKWLEIIGDDLSPIMARKVLTAITGLYFSAIFDMPGIELTRDWIKQFPDKRVGACPEELTRYWEKAIAKLQILAGQLPKTPKSIKRLIEETEREEREFSFLKTNHELGKANRKQIDRMNYLNAKNNQDTNLTQAKLNRAYRNAFADISIALLRRMVRDFVSDFWCKLSNERTDSISTRQLIARAKWRSQMTREESAIIYDTTRARRDFGGLYKLRLEQNQSWIAKATHNQVNVERWLGGIGNVKTEVDNREMTISVATNPVEIFEMGWLFNTCLSFGGCNEKSVLANAYDANKQVVFMRDEKGRSVCRQLIALTDQFKLVGYCCYVSLDNREKERRMKYISAMARFCGELARQCRVTLADDGEVELIDDHEWYDDGTHRWLSSAYQAWQGLEDSPGRQLSFLKGSTLLTYSWVQPLSHLYHVEVAASGYDRDHLG